MKNKYQVEFCITIIYADNPKDDNMDVIETEPQGVIRTFDSYLKAQKFVNKCEKKIKGKDNK